MRFQSLTEKCAVCLALGAESFESDDASFDHLQKPLQKCTILSLESDKSRGFDGFSWQFSPFRPRMATHRTPPSIQPRPLSCLCGRISPKLFRQMEWLKQTV